MKIIETKVYEYDELSDEAKEKARDWMRQTNSELGFAAEQIKENCEQVLTMFGYPTDDLGFSLGYCQGDGVAFYGSVDIEALANREVSEHYHDITGEVDHVKETAAAIMQYDGESPNIRIYNVSSHYHHWNTMKIDFVDDCDVDFIQQERIKKLAALLAEEIKAVSHQLEKEGYGIIEDEDGLIEDIRANEYTFTENGERFG